MPNLYEILAEAQHGDVMAEIGQQFGLTPQQTQAAVASLLPAISMGLKRSTETPEGLGNLFAAPQAPQPAPEQGGGLIDILRQIFQQGQRRRPTSRGRDRKRSRGRQ